MIKKMVLAIFVMLSLAAVVQAAPIPTYFWGNTSGSWSNPATWSGGSTLPDASRYPVYQDIAITIGNVTINVDSNGMSACDLMGGYSTGNSILNINAGRTLPIFHLAQVGCGSDTDSDIASLVVNVYGSFTAEMLNVGDTVQDTGTINVYHGGWLQCGFWGMKVGTAGAVGTGTINLKGGNFVLYGPIVMNPKGRINIEAGTFQVYGSRVAEMQGLINAGRIVGYDGNGLVNTPIVDGNWTLVRAIPSSQIMMTLGKGIVIDRQFHSIPVPANMKIAAADVQLIKLMGFDFAKVLVNPALMISGNTINTANMWYIDELVNNFVSMGVPVVVCLHPEPAFKTTYLGGGSGSASFQDLLGFYEDFAAYLAARWERGQVAFELMTEPFGNPAGSWNTMLPQMWQAARNGMPKNLLILDADGVASIDNLIQLNPVADANVYYSFTTYNPAVFTFQGAYWYPLGDYHHALQGVPYPSSTAIINAEKPRILAFLDSEGYGTTEATAALDTYGAENWNKSKQLAMFAPITAWNNAHGGNLKVFCAEYGVLDPNQAKVGTGIDSGCDPEDRIQFIKDRREALEESNISWAYWSYNDTFTVLRPEVRLPLNASPSTSWISNPTLDALGLPLLGCGKIVMPSSPFDLNGDCYVNFADFAKLAEVWFKCTEPTDPTCVF